MAAEQEAASTRLCPACPRRPAPPSAKSCLLPETFCGPFLPLQDSQNRLPVIARRHLCGACILPTNCPLPVAFAPTPRLRGEGQKEESHCPHSRRGRKKYKPPPSPAGERDHRKRVRPIT